MICIPIKNNYISNIIFHLALKVLKRKKMVCFQWHFLCVCEVKFFGWNLFSFDPMPVGRLWIELEMLLLHFFSKLKKKRRWRDNYFYLQCRKFCSWQKDTNVTLIVWPKHKENGTKGKPLESLTEGGKCSQNVFLSSNAFILLSKYIFLVEIIIFVCNAKSFALNIVTTSVVSFHICSCASLLDAQLSLFSSGLPQIGNFLFALWKGCQCCCSG